MWDLPYIFLIKKYLSIRFINLITTNFSSPKWNISNAAWKKPFAFTLACQSLAAQSNKTWKSMAKWFLKAQQHLSLLIYCIGILLSGTNQMNLDRNGFWLEASKGRFNSWHNEGNLPFTTLAPFQYKTFNFFGIS